LTLEMDPFPWVLRASATLYGLIGLFAARQFYRNSRNHKVWTTQKSVHFLIMIGTFVRSTFLVTGTYWWNDKSGQISLRARGVLDHELFYMLDQATNLVFLTVYLFLILFWARIYTSSKDQHKVYTQCQKLAFISFLFIITGHVVMWILYGTAWGKRVGYTDDDYAIFSASCFFWFAAFFTWFGWKTYHQIQLIPVELAVRATKAKEILWISITWTSCFTIRAGLLLWIANDGSVLQMKFAYVFIAVFFFLLELIPLVVVLYFYRHIPNIILNSNAHTQYPGLLALQSEDFEVSVHFQVNIV